MSLSIEELLNFGVPSALRDVADKRVAVVSLLTVLFYLLPPADHIYPDSDEISEFAGRYAERKMLKEAQNRLTKEMGELHGLIFGLPVDKAVRAKWQGKHFHSELRRMTSQLEQVELMLNPVKVPPSEEEPQF